MGRTYKSVVSHQQPINKMISNRCLVFFGLMSVLVLAAAAPEPEPEAEAEAEAEPQRFYSGNSNFYNNNNYRSNYRGNSNFYNRPGYPSYYSNSYSRGYPSFYSN